MRRLRFALRSSRNGGPTPPPPAGLLIGWAAAVRRRRRRPRLHLLPRSGAARTALERRRPRSLRAHPRGRLGDPRGPRVLWGTGKCARGPPAGLRRRLMCASGPEKLQKRSQNKNRCPHRRQKIDPPRVGGGPPADRRRRVESSRLAALLAGPGAPRGRGGAGAAARGPEGPLIREPD